MYKFPKRKEVGLPICKQCFKEFNPKNHGSKKLFCSNSCSALYQWKYRNRKPAKRKIIKCKECGKEFEVYQSLWIKRNMKFCSYQCSGKYQRKKDGMTKYQRYAKKRGWKKRGSPEWIENIKAKTKEAMNRPEIKAKISQPKSPMSIQTRINISNALAGKMPKNIMFGLSGSFSNVKRGDYENSKGTMYFRSRWEANYALYLDFLVKQNKIKDWQYEPDVFIFEKIQFGTRSYRPDFKVFNFDDSFEYHEVKGHMDGKSKTKLKRMQKYYPEVKLILIDREYYMEIKKQIGKMLNFYD